MGRKYIGKIAKCWLPSGTKSKLGNLKYSGLTAVPRAQKKETQARANCSAVPTQLALCLRLAIDL